jgi:hypothetical protein
MNKLLIFLLVGGVAIVATSFFSVQREYCPSEPLKELVVSELHPRWKRISKVEITTYKVNEDKYNETDSLSGGVVVLDANNVPNIIALPPYLEQKGFKLGDTCLLVHDGFKEIIIFADRMSSKPQYRRKVDKLINHNQRFFSTEGVLYKLRDNNEL